MADKGLFVDGEPVPLAECMHPKSVDALHDQIVGIDHVAVAVADLDQAVHWYQATLGFVLAEKRVTEGEHSAMVSAVMRAGGATVVLVQGLSENSQVSQFINRYGAGVHHIAFAVKDIDTAIQLAANAGVPDTPVISVDGVRQVYLSRNEATGVRVELIESGNGVFSDSSIKQLYRALEEKNLY